MKNRLISAIAASAYTSSFVLCILWLASKNHVMNLSSPSGWWWFGCFIVGIFFSNLIED
jgi:hypothetical protein